MYECIYIYIHIHVYICIHMYTFIHIHVQIYLEHQNRFVQTGLDAQLCKSNRVDPWDFGSQDRLCQAVWVSGTSTDLFPTRLWYAEAWEEL